MLEDFHSNLYQYMSTIQTKAKFDFKSYVTVSKHCWNQARLAILSKKCDFFNVYHQFWSRARAPTRAMTFVLTMPYEDNCFYMIKCPVGVRALDQILKSSIFSIYLFCAVYHICSLKKTCIMPPYAFYLLLNGSISVEE